MRQAKARVACCVRDSSEARYSHTWRSSANRSLVGCAGESGMGETRRGCRWRLGT